LISPCHPTGINLIAAPVARMAALVTVWLAFVASALLLVYRPLLRGRYYSRRASEAAADPRASMRLRRERRLWVGGLTVGVVVGALTVASIVYRVLGG
jgi:hypothetical protein